MSINALEGNLSINALEGSQGSETIRALDHFQNKQLLILVDSGSNHSFLDAKVAKELKVPVVSVPTISVKVADRRKVFNTEKAPGFS